MFGLNRRKKQAQREATYTLIGLWVLEALRAQKEARVAANMKRNEESHKRARGNRK